MWSLKIVQGAELADKPVVDMRLPMPLVRFSIGRDPGNPWPIADRTLALSARHCEVVATPAGPALRDLSTNGTFVNGSVARMAGDHLLRDGDRIEIGPFVIAVSGPPLPTRVAAPVVPAPVAAVRPPGGMDAAPQRGGDPAAMLAAGAAGAPVGLTEILRVAAPVQDSAVDMTKIRLAPPPRAAAPAPAPAPAPVPVPAPVAAAPPPTNLSEALARGLGVPASALAGQDPLWLAERLARCAQGATAALRQLLEQQAQARRTLGSRQSVRAAGPDLSPLRLSPSAQAALLALVAAPGDPAELLQRAGTELGVHQDKLLRAFRQAALRLGEQASPESLLAGLGVAGDSPPSPAQQTRLWQLYTTLWNDLGLAPGAGWAAGFQEAALQHLAAAYDDTPP